MVKPGETTGTEPLETTSPGGATDRNCSAAPPGLDGFGPRSRWFHHRLISRVPPGRRTIPDLYRNYGRAGMLAKLGLSATFFFFGGVDSTLQLLQARY